MELAERFMALFPAASYGRGVYDMRRPVQVNGKLKAAEKDRFSVKEKAALKHWDDHLHTTRGLGLIPIEHNGKVKDKCMWAAVDIDRYGADYSRLIEIVSKSPLIPVVSKSGGIHLYVFFQKWTSAKGARAQLLRLSSELGFGGSEVFPKQEKVDLTREDGANWINMPYAHLPNTTRYAVTAGGVPMTPTEFLDEAEGKKTTLTALATLSFVLDSRKVDHDEVPDGPPCLQQLTEIGFPQGSMNRALFNLAVYYRKAFPDDWEDRVREANKRWMGPGSNQEVQAIISSVAKREYFYTCKEEPLCSHCNKIECSKRKYGMSNTVALPDIENFTKVKTDPPVYFVEIAGKKIGPLQSAELLDCSVMAKIIFEITGVPVAFKRADWLKLLGVLSAGATEVDAPEDTGVIGRFQDVLLNFLTSSLVTDEKEALAANRIYGKKDLREFRLESLKRYLDQNEIKMPWNNITAILKNAGLKSKQVRIKEKVYRVWIARGIAVDKSLTKKRPKKEIF